MPHAQAPLPNRIPDRWEEITPAWMTAVLSRHDPGVEVRDVRILMRDDGTNRRARLGLSYARGAGPATVFLKANEPAHRAVHLRNGNLFNEAQLFGSDVDLAVDHPIVYHAIVDRDDAGFLLVMEDLTARHADPRDATRPMSIEQVANGLRGLARLHSRYWGLSDTTQPRLGWVQTWAPTAGWQVGLNQRIPLGLERAAADLPEAVKRYRGEDIVDLWSRYVTSLAKPPMTLLHGDAHIGNTYVLPDGTVGFLDWQVVRRGQWSQDVGYFLVGSLTEDDRRHAERALIEEYRKALQVPAAERPSSDEAWQCYRTTPAYGLAIWLSTLGTDGWQSRDVSMALVRRFASAFVELDTPSALDS